MSRLDEDSRIKELFEAQRRENQKCVPSLDRVVAGSKPGRRTVTGFPAWGWAAGALAVILLVVIPAVLLVQNGTGETELVADLNVSEWESPTDFLLSYGDESLITAELSLDVELMEWGKPDLGSESEPSRGDPQ